MPYVDPIVGYDRTPEQRLLAAVVGLSIRDCCDTPATNEHKKPRLTHESATALDFIFTDLSEGFLDYLDIDAGHFRRKLIEVMNDTSNSDVPFKSMQRRNFRINYKLWKSQYDRLGGRVARHEEETSDDSRIDVEE